ncbi:phospholipase [Streptomyces sp. NPDC048636]|uniref:phospholipase n=1 Tax=Streptomyces sp. NPDC048636 TaxID=3155762 RepID=UPI00344144ED
MRRLVTTLATTAVAAATAVALAAPAQAVPADKEQVLASWTDTSASSYDTWLSASNSQGSWADYEFDWSTDYCSSSPDNPFGFPFQTACARHDFGYRNHKAMGIFDANKARIDSAFYEDLKRVCNNYDGGTKTACDSTAWTYYQAVKILG